MSKAKSGSVFQRNKKLANGEIITLPTWWIQYRKDGETYRESSKSRVYAVADKLLKRRQGEIVTGKFAGFGPERITFRELSKEIVDDYKTNGKTSLDHVQRRLDLHLLPALGDLRAADFGTAHIRKYIQARQKEEASNATINRELAIIKRVFRLAFRSDPPKVARVPYVPMLKENNVRKGFLEEEQYAKLRDALPEEIRPLFVVLYHTGARVGEMKALQWRQVDLSALRITLDPGTTKNDEARVLPIYGEMTEWLRIEKEIRDQNYPECPYVFRRGGKPIKNFVKSWAAATVLAGVPGLLVHDLRRSAVRNMDRRGVHEVIARKVSGHKTRSIYDRYNIVSEADLKLFVAKMDAPQEGARDSSSTQPQKQAETAAPVSTPEGSISTLFSTLAVSKQTEKGGKKHTSRLN